MEDKGLGRTIGHAVSNAVRGSHVPGSGRSGRRVRHVAYDANAVDRDDDGIIQEGTDQVRRAIAARKKPAVRNKRPKVRKVNARRVVNAPKPEDREGPIAAVPKRRARVRNPKFDVNAPKKRRVRNVIKRKPKKLGIVAEPGKGRIKKAKKLGHEERITQLLDVHPALRAQQDIINGHLNNIGEDGGVANVRELLADLKAERDLYGQEIRKVDARWNEAEDMRNAKRRWLDANIEKTVTALRGEKKGKPTSRTNRSPVLGRIHDEDGFPIKITNSKIKTTQDAVAHLKSGGSLGDVPNQFWAAALYGNSSTKSHDSNSLFKDIEPTSGAIGVTRIFVLRDKNGNAGQTGYVLKGASSNENLGEVVSQYLMTEHGMQVEGAGFDGKGKDIPVWNRRKDAASLNQQMVVLPFFTNDFQEGIPQTGEFAGREVNYGSSVFKQDPHRALSERVSGLLHNYMLGVSDRHKNNGFAFVLNGNVHVVPIDQGWAGRAPTSGPISYGNSVYGMDMIGNLTSDGARVFPSGKPLTEIDRQAAQDIVDTYDRYIESAQRVVDAGLTHMISGIGQAQPLMPSEDEYIKKLFNMYAKNLDNLRRERKQFLSSILPAHVVTELGV